MLESSLKIFVAMLLLGAVPPGSEDLFPDGSKTITPTIIQPAALIQGPTNEEGLFWESFFCAQHYRMLIVKVSYSKLKPSDFMFVLKKVAPKINIGSLASVYMQSTCTSCRVASYMCISA